MIRPANPARTDYVFDGWYKEAGCISSWNFATDTVSAPVTLYAKWSKLAYSVVFDLNGGTVGSSGANFTQAIDWGDKANDTIF